jgi:hypothetical protein
MDQLLKKILYADCVLLALAFIVGIIDLKSSLPMLIFMIGMWFGICLGLYLQIDTKGRGRQTWLGLMLLILAFLGYTSLVLSGIEVLSILGLALYLITSALLITAITILKKYGRI